MSVRRCPECGNRLTSNYCDICMRRVPFAGMRTKQALDPWDYSSAHREEEDHECVSFDTPKPASPRKPVLKPVFPKSKSAKKTGKKKPVIAIILAVVSLFGFINNLREEIGMDTPEPEYNAEAFAPEGDLPTIQPETIQVADEVFVTAETLGLYYEAPAVSFVIDNKSDGDIEVMVEEVAVNGCMIDTGMYMEVAAEESCQGFLCLYQYDLEKMGITEIGRLDIRLRIYDQEDYSQVLYLDTWTIYTDIGENYTQPVVDSGMELYNDGSTCVLAGDLSVYDYGNGELEMFAENLSASDVMVTVSELRLNGQEVEGYLVATLLPETCAIDTLYILDLDDLEIREVGQIEELSFTLQIDYMEDWNILESYTESITVTPNP